MKLFKRIKAEHAANPLESMTPGPVMYVPKSPDSVDVAALSFPAPEGKGITAKHQIPYDLMEDIDPLKNKMADLIADSIDKNMMKKVATKAPILKDWKHNPYGKQIDAYLDFPNPAKNGHIVGVWAAKLEEVEKDLMTGKHRIALRVLDGHDKGKVLVFSEGDTLTINYSVSL